MHEDTDDLLQEPERGRPDPIQYLGVFGKTMVEREVFESSYQYSEARKSEIATYEAGQAMVTIKPGQ
jgi:hypothetical protein